MFEEYSLTEGGGGVLWVGDGELPGGDCIGVGDAEREGLGDGEGVGDPDGDGRGVGLRLPLGDGVGFGQGSGRPGSTVWQVVCDVAWNPGCTAPTLRA